LSPLPEKELSPKPPLLCGAPNLLSDPTFDSFVKELPTALPTFAELSLPPLVFPTFLAKGLKTFFLEPPNRLFFDGPAGSDAFLSGLVASSLPSIFGDGETILLKLPVF
jgi:hypothetical protein